MKKYIYISLIAGLVFSCSTKKDRFVNRNWHSLNTKYNVLFNGQEAFEKGLKDINTKYEDNFWQLLPIEPLAIDDNTLPGVSMTEKEISADFERAEEKAIKAIQKHSMNIRSKEKNPQIDDAYLLLGKGRYYSQRFVPALEAFNHVIKSYPTASLINETKVWQAKTHIRLRNEEQGIETLEILLSKKSLDSRIKEDAHTAMALAYTSLDSVEAVVSNLKSAVETDENKEQRARNLFVLGQLYKEQGHTDSSDYAFQEILETKRVSKKYKIYAQIEKAKNHGEEDREELIATFKKLIKDVYNRPYHDALYYQLGETYYSAGRLAEAEEAYKKSLSARVVGKYQKGITYEALGNLYFEKARFIDAGAYYDSVLSSVDNKNTKRIRSLIRKREKLNDVIKYEGIAAKNDSIIHIASLPEEEQRQIYTKYIKDLKEEEERQKNVLLNAGTFGATSSGFESGGKGGYYFYNQQTVAYGMQDFRRIWGDRLLEDNWRLSDKTKTNFEEEVVEEIDVIDESKKFDIDYYIGRIPNAQQVDSIGTVRNDAYYQLGLIYKEQFKERDLAIDRLTTLLTYQPEARLELPAKYHLYKLYEGFDEGKALGYKNNIIEKYPTSKYAQILNNPEAYLASKGEADSPENIYKQVYAKFKEEQFQEVLKDCDTYIIEFADDPILSKFELLKAYTEGKTKDKESFIKALEYVALNYPNTQEGKHAKELLATLKGEVVAEVEKKEMESQQMPNNAQTPKTEAERRKEMILKKMKDRNDERKKIEKKVKEK